MVSAFGPWCDSTHMTDPGVLVDIAMRSRTAAVGVLANTNITGPDVARVAEHAHWTAANVDDIRAEWLLFERTVRDQLVIFDAANTKSRAAAERLIPYLSPGAVAALYQRATTTRMKGGAWIQDDLTRVASSRRWARFAADPDFDTVADLIGDVASDRVLAVKAIARMGDRAALIDLTPTLADAGDPGAMEPGDTDVDTLLLATVGHPDVVVHWAHHGGTWGRLVAARDHRQDAQFLLTLVGPDTLGGLVLNPRVPEADRARLVGERIAELMLANDPNRLRAACNRATDIAATRGVWNRIDVDDWSTATDHALVTLTSHYGEQVSMLMAYEWLTHEKVDDENILHFTLTDQLLLAHQPGLPDGHLLKELFRVEYSQWGDRLSSMGTNSLVAEFGPVPLSDTQIANWSKQSVHQFGASFPRTACRGVYAPAAYLVQHLSTGAQFIELFAQMNRTPVASLGEVVEATLAAHPSEPSVPADAFDAVLGNALGAW